jgi:hypothetical protein
VYASEGRDARVLDHLRRVAAAQPGVLLAASFVDGPYHRSSYTLVSRSPDAVRLGGACGVQGEGSSLLEALARWLGRRRGVPGPHAAANAALQRLLRGALRASDTSPPAPRTPAQLTGAAAAVAEAALDVIDLRTHDATHPRLGAVDHISCHPVPQDLDLSGSGGAGSRAVAAAAGSGGGAAEHARSGASASGSRRRGGGSGGADAAAAAALEGAARVARDIGRRLAGAGGGLPVYLYGAAHSEGRKLADVRRRLGACRRRRAGWWRGPSRIFRAASGISPCARGPEG